MGRKQKEIGSKVLEKEHNKNENQTEGMYVELQKAD